MNAHQPAMLLSDPIGLIILPVVILPAGILPVSILPVSGIRAGLDA